MFPEVLGIVAPVLEDLASDEADKATEKLSSRKSSIQDQTIAAGIDALCESLNSEVVKQASAVTYQQQILQIITTASLNTDIGVQNAISLGIKGIFDRLHKASPSPPPNNADADVATGYLKALHLSRGDGAEALRLKRWQAADAILTTCTESSLLLVKAALFDQLSVSHASERSPSVRSFSDKVLARLGK